jgi:cytochrome c553
MRSALLLLSATSICSAAAERSLLTFEQDVRPILKTHCFHCHGEAGEKKGGLDVRLVRYLQQGGKHGAAIVASQPEQSRLLQMVKAGEMPEGKAKLPDQDIATLEKWIAQGARTLRPEPESLGAEHAFTEEERGWWALQPLRKAFSQHTLDGFIHTELAKAKLTPSPAAEPVALIRRMTLDLHGLPPTPEEVDAFVTAHTRHPLQAIQQLTDRLLSSPLYGERWGRHWLDVAGYADSDGYDAKDIERKWAFKYRDYVVRALNADKPFDLFVQEQLAGDELVPQPHKNLSPAQQDQLAATGFLRMAPDGTAVDTSTVAKNACVAETIKIVSSAFYGLTIGCAQCHDHRYDPILQADYYRLRAIFEPGFDTKAWRAPASRLISLHTDSQLAEAAKIEAKAKEMDAERLKKQALFLDDVLAKELAKAPEKERELLNAAYRQVAAKRSPAQTALLKQYPKINQLSAGSLYLYDYTYKTDYAAQLKAMTEQATALRATKPKEDFLPAFTELPRKDAAAVPATFIFHRGDPEQPKEAVKPGDLSVLASRRKVDLPEKSTALPSTGRRLAYAMSLTDGQHPLLARVMVNRVWAHHFGKGLVPSVGDFGKLGQTPSHPELLDWLASRFMTEGWSLKKLHRLILSSATYQQSSRSQPNSVDADNRLLSHFPLRRLEAESLRDSLLAVSGKLNYQQGGPAVPVMFNTEGQVVIGIDTTDTAGRQTGKFLSLNGQEFRRSLYVQVRRTRPLEMFATFDAPSMQDTNCDSRPVTTVSPQSLLIMNSSAMREHAGHFAQRVMQEQPQSTAAQVRRAWRLCYQTEMSMADEQEALALVSDLQQHYTAHPAKLQPASGPVPKDNTPPALLALSAYCHALLSSNAFLYID